MKKTFLIFIWLLLSTLESHAIWAADEYGSMFVSGALVHYIHPENNRRNVTIIAVPGLNLSSYIFVTTPDGRSGWAQMLAADGYDVYVINDPRFDFIRGGFSVPPFTVPTEGAPPADPGSGPGWDGDIWPRWGFGDSAGSPYPDTRFPTNFFDEFANNYPYVSSSSANYTTAIVALLDMTDSAWLMAHSAGGPRAIDAAKIRPDLVYGFLMIEPTNPPGENDFPSLSGLSLFGVYGDYIDSRNQGSRKAGTEAAAALFTQNGGDGEVISLPDDLGVFGNTHLMMQDNNNDFVLEQILNWLDRVPPPPGETPSYIDGFEAPGI